jgi:hypothetical protein
MVPLLAIIGVATATQVATSVAGQVENTKQSKELVKAQGEHDLKDAVLKWGNGLNSAPKAVGN